MALRDDWNNQYTPDLFAELSEVVTYTPFGGLAIQVNAIFHRDYIHVKVSGGMGSEVSNPVFITQDSIVANPQAGDVWVFNNISYTTIEVARTRAGITVNICNLTNG